MPEHRTCPECGAVLCEAALRGLCPKCLAREAGLEPDRKPFPEAGLPRAFGDYELLEELGRGGMGIVYKARQKSLGRTVAIKMLLDGPLANLATAGRFRSEAAAAAQLRHPNIAAIYEIGERDGLLYFSMDYITGVSLADLARRRPLPVETAVKLVKTIADTIQFAHQRGTIHRDLKPSNVILDEAGQPHILDFGLAKRVEAHGDFTLTGQSLGSPGYAPPEQVDTKRARMGSWSDVYGLGAILYFLLTGRAPFVGDSLTDTLYQTLHSPPKPPRSLNPEVPAELEAVCLKCLEKDPTDRYESAGELADELERFLNGKPLQNQPDRPAQRVASWSHRSPVLAWSLILGVAAIAFGVIWVARQAGSLGETAQEAAADFVFLSTPVYQDCGVVVIDGGVTPTASPLIWVWGDGTSNHSIFPSTHKYASNGTYQLSLTTLFQSGKSKVVSETAKIVNVCPPNSPDTRNETTVSTKPESAPNLFLDLRDPVYGDCGVVSINGVVTSGAWPLTWSWGDGATNQSAFPASHKYESNGTYVVTLTASSKAGETVATETVTITNASIYVIQDPLHNLVGDTNRTFLDVQATSVRKVGTDYSLEVSVVGQFPTPSEMTGGRQFDFMWFVAAGRKTTTAQVQGLGNDYNIHIFFNDTGWQTQWYKVSPFSKNDGITTEPNAFVIQASTNRVSLMFPQSYLPTRSFDIWHYASTENANNWEPATFNPVTERKRIEF